jgi:hypothetical protein
MQSSILDFPLRSDFQLLFKKLDISSDIHRKTDVVDAVHLTQRQASQAGSQG